MSIEIRRLTPEELPQNAALMSQAFSQGAVPSTDPPDEAKQADYLATVWAIFDGDRLQSSLRIRPFQVHWGEESILPMGGIAGVSTAPEARGAGHVDALLRHALASMREQGQVISALYPFSWSFYRKYGWDWVGDRRQMTLPLDYLPKFPESRGLAVRVDDPDKTVVRERLTAAYTEFARRYRGVFDATTHSWGGIEPRDGRLAYVFQYPPTGEYFTWRYDTDGKTGRIGQWIVWSAAGHEALLSVIHYLAVQCEKAKLTVPADTLLPQYLMHWNVKTTLGPVFMGRVVDVGAAISHLPAPEGISGSMPVRIRDEHAPWNDGIWRIVVEDGKCSAEKAADQSSTPTLLSMDIQTFSQAFWGFPSLDSLRATGRVKVREDFAFDWLKVLLPPKTVFTMDGF